MAKKDKGTLTGDPLTYQIPAPAGGVQMETFIPWTLVKRGVRRQVITPIGASQEFESEAVAERRARKAAKDSPLIRALGLAHYWQKLLNEGRYRSLTEISAAEGIDRGQASRIALMIRLAPEVVNAVLSDRRAGVMMVQLVKGCQTAFWKDQLYVLDIKQTVHTTDKVN